MKAWFRTLRLPQPPLFTAAFGVLAVLLVSLILIFHLPPALLFLLAPLFLLAVLRYPAWVRGSLLGASFAAAVVVSLLLPAAPASSILNILLTAAGICALGGFFWWMMERQRRRAASLDERFHTIMDSAHFMETWQRPDDTFEYVSPSSEVVCGYQPEDFYLNPRLFYEIIHPEDRRLFEEACQNTRRRGRSVQRLELRLLHRSGKTRWIEHHLHALYDKNDVYLGRRATTLDITERKVGADSLRVKFDRLMAAIEGTEDGVWDINLQDGSLYFTPQYARLLGKPFDRPDACLKDLYAIIHPDDMPAVLEAFKAHLLWKTPNYQAEYRLLTPQGKWRWVLERGKIIEQDNSGKPLRMVGTHVDITARKRVEEALQQSETKFRQLAENMREVFWLREKETGEFIYVNPAFTAIWGRTPEELYKNQNIFMESIHWEDLARLLHALTDLAEDGKILNEEFRVLQPDGSVRWIWMRAYPIIEGRQFSRIAGIAEDATERKKVENALRDSERRYRDLIEHQGGGVSIIDPHQTIVYMNPAGEEIFGVPRGTLASRNMKEFLDDDQFAFLQSQSNIRQSGIETSFELVITRPDHEKRSLLMTATPRFDVNGQFLGVIIIFRDITQRKQTEDRLRYISMHDSLTELYNRAFFEDEVARLEQVGRFPVSVIMVDVDGLKQVNDQMGHDVGDQMLRRTASVLKDSVRSDDVVARLGGDEFAILMPGSDESAMQHVLTRIQLNVNQENERGHNPFTLSVSAGGATCIQRGSLRQTIKEADQRMYRVKEEQKKRYFFSLPVNTARKTPPEPES